jgi:16S rRNA (guanine(527)-N(7))-methyltransferase RsmG
MHPARIAELLQPFLGPSQDLTPKAENLLSNISTYINLLLRWNARINLTAIHDPEEIVTRHFGESLFAARHLFPRDVRVGLGLRPGQAGQSPASDRRPAAGPENPHKREGRGFSRSDATSNKQRDLAPEAPANDRRPFLACPELSEGTADHCSLADLGSGAGFPGLPIKLWAPHIALTLIESNHKKAAFLREVTRALTLTDVNILAARAETLAGISFDLVTLRAVERFAHILLVAASLVAPGGRLALLIGPAQLDQAYSSLSRMSWSLPEPVPNSKSRVLAVAHSHK